MITLNELATNMHYALFWETPYDTGNLARNGIGDVGVMGGGVGFRLFDSHLGAVGKGTGYGRILNEASVINGRRTNLKTGITHTWSYINKHYQWVDKFADKWANELTLYAQLRRIQ